MTMEEAIQRLYRMGRSHVGIIDENTLADNKALSMAIESLSAAEPKMGEWIGDKCSRCGSERAWYGRQPDYCPDCGAKMRGEDE